MSVPSVKEEPQEDNLVEINFCPQATKKSTRTDDVIASYSIVPVENNKFKVFNISGLSKVTCRKKNCEIFIRTDLKGFRISYKKNNLDTVFCTKETQINLKKKTFAVKLSRETGKAYFIPINSQHSLTFLDAENRSCKAIDAQNSLFEDCSKMPYLAKNKHNQQLVEMKNNLYKRLEYVATPEMMSNFLNHLFSSVSKRSLNQNSVLTNKTDNKIENYFKSDTEIMNLINCPYWYTKKINFCDLNHIEMLDLKIEVFLRKAQVIRFEEILYVFINTDLHKLLNILQNICYLIRGNWVIKSHLLYKLDALHDSEIKQQQLKRMIAAREYLLWLFTTNKPINVSHIFDKFKKTNDYEEILNRLTIRNYRWESSSDAATNIDFILSEDVQFIRNYAAIAKRHHEKTKELLNSKHQEYLMILNSC